MYWVYVCVVSTSYHSTSLEINVFQKQKMCFLDREKEYFISFQINIFWFSIEKKVFEIHIILFFSCRHLDIPHSYPKFDICNQSPCCTFVPWVISWISLARPTDRHSSTTSHHQGGKILASYILVIDQCQIMPRSTFWGHFQGG